MRNQSFIVAALAAVCVVGCGRSDEPSADASKTSPDAPRSVVFDVAASQAQMGADAVNDAAKAWDKLVGLSSSDSQLQAAMFAMDWRDGFTDRYHSFLMERRKADGRSVRELLASAGFKPLVVDALLK